MSSSKGSTCKHCRSRCCVSYGGAPFCLLHYHAFSTHGKDDVIKAKITNEEEAMKQMPGVENLLREAMTDVLMGMHDLQQEEQRMLQADPLAVLSLHAPSSSFNATSMNVSVPSNHQSQRQKPLRVIGSAVKSKNLKKDDLWHISSCSSSGKSRDQEEVAAWQAARQELELRRQVSGEAAYCDDYLYSRGPPCSQCSSADTLVKYDSSSVSNSNSGTRGEIWGRKDSSEGGHVKSTVLCKACGFEKIQISS